MHTDNDDPVLKGNLQGLRDGDTYNIDFSLRGAILEFLASAAVIGVILYLFCFGGLDRLTDVMLSHLSPSFDDLPAFERPDPVYVPGTKLCIDVDESASDAFHVGSTDLVLSDIFFEEADQPQSGKQLVKWTKGDQQYVCWGAWRRPRTRAFPGTPRPPRHLAIRLFHP